MGGVYNVRMDTSVSQEELQVTATRAPGPVVMPTLLGVGYGNYDAQPNNFVYSFVIHLIAVFAIIYSTHFMVQHAAEIKQNVITLIAPDDMVLSPSKKVVGGGGGGGERAKLDASKGHPPKFDMKQITPPAVIVRNQDPKLAVQQTLAVPPQVKMPTSQVNVGDPLAKALIASNGIGAGSGIGSGTRGGVGSGNGRGLGPGSQAGTGGGVFRVGGGVSAPTAIFSPDPDYSDEARKAKYQGVVVLHLTVGPDGKPRDIQVARTLGMGLDEKAIEAVKTWRFDPARKDGQPVAVAVNIEVNFNLY